MTPASRDRNLGRVRGLTAGVAGASLAACGLFAGLAASATKKAVTATTATTTQVVKKKVAVTSDDTPATTASTTTTTSPSLSAPASTPVQTYSPPVATSGGS